MGKLTSKGKHTVKARNDPYTNTVSKTATMSRGEYKCRKWELHLKLRDQQLKTTLYIYRLLYCNLMGNANKKLQQVHTQKRESNLNKTLKRSSNHKRREQRERVEKRPTKTNQKQLRKWQEEHTY